MELYTLNMGTTLTKSSTELVSRLIKNEFDKIDFTMEYIYNRAEKLINTARDLGLNDLSNELTEETKQLIK